MGEEWRDIPGYEGRYQVSDLGRIRNRKGKLCVPNLHRLGYLKLALRTDGIRRMHYVHRLVASAFLTPSGPEKTEVNHKDGIKTNNNFTNLEWATRSENMRHAAGLGLLNPPDNRGAKHGMSKLTDADVLAIRKLKNKFTQTHLADVFGVSRRAVGMVLSGKRWRHVA